MTQQCHFQWQITRDNTTSCSVKHSILVMQRWHWSVTYTTWIQQRQVQWQIPYTDTTTPDSVINAIHWYCNGMFSQWQISLSDRHHTLINQRQFQWQITHTDTTTRPVSVTDRYHTLTQQRQVQWQIPHTLIQPKTYTQVHGYNSAMFSDR